MRKHLLLVLAACLAIVSLSYKDALAQTSSPDPKVEVGAQFTILRLRDLGVTEVGVGPRVTYNVNQFLSIEAEADFFPRDNQNLGGSGRKTEGFFGGLLGYRSSGFAIYSKIRPGFIHFTRDPFADPVSSTDFAVDIGGVFEFYPSRRSMVRFDVGDTAIRFGSQTVIPTPFGPVNTGTYWSHNLQFSAGVGLRF
jgi:hypothetical protein